MGSKTKWIEHNGKKVVFNDLSNLSGNTYVEAIKESIDFTLQLKQTGILSVTNVRGSKADTDVLFMAKQHAELSKRISKKAAVVGLKGTEFYFLQIVGTVSSFDIKPFDRLEEALDWLTAD